MLIEIDKSVLAEAQNGNQLAFDVLNTLAMAQRMEWHALWADRKVLDGIIQLPPEKLGDNIRMYRGVLKGITTRKLLFDAVSTKAVVSFSEKMRRENNVIFIKPVKKLSFSFFITTLLTENLSDGYMFEHIANWYLRKVGLGYTFFCKIDKQHGGGNTIDKVYIEYSEKKKDRFCLCIADSDIKADVKSLLENNLINESQCPSYGDTYKNVCDYDCKNKPYNCACYGFENVLEVENLIPFCIIEKDNNYKQEVAALKSAKILDHLSYFDFKKGFTKLSEASNYVQVYWKKLIFKNRALPALKGFGDKLFGYILEKYDSDFSKIDDSMLSPAQLKEYEEIGKRVFSWCCTMSIARAKV